MMEIRKGSAQVCLFSQIYELVGKKCLHLQPFIIYAGSISGSNLNRVCASGTHHADDPHEMIERNTSSVHTAQVYYWYDKCRELCRRGRGELGRYGNYTLWSLASIVYPQ